MSRRRSDDGGGYGCLLGGVVVWLLIAGYVSEQLAGPGYPEWLFYGLAFGIPGLLLLWLLWPFKRRG
jgi:hypothetical protein